MLFSRKNKFVPSILFYFYTNFLLLGIYTSALHQCVYFRIKSLMHFTRKVLIQKRTSFLFCKIFFLRIPLYALQQKVNSYIWAFMLFSRKNKFVTSILLYFYTNFLLLGIYTYALNQSVNSRIKSLMLFSRKELIQKRKSFKFGKIFFLRIPLYALQQKVNSYI